MVVIVNICYIYYVSTYTKYIFHILYPIIYDFVGGHGSAVPMPTTKHGQNYHQITSEWQDEEVLQVKVIYMYMLYTVPICMCVYLST